MKNGRTQEEGPVSAVIVWPGGCDSQAPGLTGSSYARCPGRAPRRPRAGGSREPPRAPAPCQRPRGPGSPLACRRVRRGPEPPTPDAGANIAHGLPASETRVGAPLAQGGTRRRRRGRRRNGGRGTGKPHAPAARRGTSTSGGARGTQSCPGAQHAARSALAMELNP
ncbi:unnamed protein product [Prorocentrum cordatum]|uniref:Uncharacterized protein n=1 Tax=Prorocentrum cordatum TaxID=2364126 RepID=A0ABN9SYY7_9DINO|nr:unnamed protein product [Polarella glacialis]